MHAYIVTLFPVKCKSLKDLSSGSLTYATNGSSTVVGADCGDGFTLAGEATLTCLEDGSWSTDLPSCGKL